MSTSDPDSAGEGSEVDDSPEQLAQPQPDLHRPVLDQAKTKYAEFLKTLIQLKQYNPEEYEEELQEIFSAAVQDEGSKAALEEYSFAVMSAINPNETKHLFDRFVERAGRESKRKSELWLKLEAFLDKWEDIIIYGRTLIPIEEAVVARKGQCYDLRVALKSTKYNGVRYYLDDKLIEVMERIIQTGQTYSSNILGVFKYNWAGGFNDFLSELREINDLRLANKLQTTNLSLFSTNRNPGDVANVHTMVTVLLERLSLLLEQNHERFSELVIAVQEADHFNKATFRKILEKFEIVILTPQSDAVKVQREKLYIELQGDKLKYTFKDLFKQKSMSGIISKEDFEVKDELNYPGLMGLFTNEMTPDTVKLQSHHIVHIIGNRGHEPLNTAKQQRLRAAQENPKLLTLTADRRQLRVENSRLAAENNVLISTHKAELKSMSQELENERSARAAAEDRLYELESELSELRSGVSSLSSPSSPNHSDSDASESTSPMADATTVTMPRDKLDRVARRLFYTDDSAAPKKLFDQANRTVVPVPILDGLSSDAEKVVTAELN